MKPVKEQGEDLMPRSNNALAKKEWDEDLPSVRPVFVLESQLMDTLELQWHVQQSRVQLAAVGHANVQNLIDGLSAELRGFTDMIRDRLRLLKIDGAHSIEWSS